MDWHSIVAGFLVGAVVGLTGVGGGSLMSPILILMFKVAPSAAVGTDLWFAAITKLFGSAMHHRQQSADWGIAKWLWFGSIPAAIITVVLLSASGVGPIKGGVITHTLGAVLIVSAIITPFRGRLTRAVARVDFESAARFVRYQPALTILAGVLLGALVTLTSVGAGAIGATLLLLLYPLRLSSKRLVGTDILHAVPVALVGGIGHLLIGDVKPWLLLSLLVGSIPGIMIGSRMTAWLPDQIIQPTLALVLFFSGFKLLGA
jgi:uncharacterized protein